MDGCDTMDILSPDRRYTAYNTNKLRMVPQNKRRILNFDDSLWAVSWWIYQGWWCPTAEFHVMWESTAPSCLSHCEDFPFLAAKNPNTARYRIFHLLSLKISKHYAIDCYSLLLLMTGLVHEFISHFFVNNMSFSSENLVLIAFMFAFNLRVLKFIRLCLGLSFWDLLAVSGLLLTGEFDSGFCFFFFHFVCFLAQRKFLQLFTSFLCIRQILGLLKLYLLSFYISLYLKLFMPGCERVSKLYLLVHSFESINVLLSLILTWYCHADILKVLKTTFFFSENSCIPNTCFSYQ